MLTAFKRVSGAEMWRESVKNDVKVALVQPGHLDRGYIQKNLISDFKFHI